MLPHYYTLGTSVRNPKILVAIPVYNESKHVRSVLTEVRRYAEHILVVNDGSTDGTSELLDTIPNLLRVNHPRNRGYGAAIRSAFDYAIANDFDVLVTMDCDGQHQPERIPVLLEALGSEVQMVSGSRYLRDFRQDTPAPTDRRGINAIITEELNIQYGLNITDAFCGFKAYCVKALADLRLSENGWGMPLQLWVQSAHLNWIIREVGVPRLYLDANRAFGGVMNDPDTRLNYYREVIRTTEEASVSLERSTFAGCHG
jgi:glycosyltransferase involved in cell wall biosynthesis